MNKILLSFCLSNEQISLLGNSLLLEQPITAFFASRKCSGKAIRATMDWALKQATNKTTIISGFHSPLEQSVLNVMLVAKSPVIVVLARRLPSVMLSKEWCEAVALGSMALVSTMDQSPRLTKDLAMQRNHLIADHAAKIVIAELRAEGNLAMSGASWYQQGYAVEYLVGNLN